MAILLAVVLALIPSAALAAGPGHDELTCLTTAFMEWAAAPPAARTHFEMPGVEIASRPAIGIAYSRSHFFEFESKPGKICPVINGVRCSAPSDGLVLNFTVRLAGQQLPGGSVQFTKRGQIVGYDGPLDEFTKILTVAEARQHAVSKCNGGGAKIDESPPTIIVARGPDAPIGHLQAYGVPTYTRGVLKYRFEMVGRPMKHCLEPFCTVEVRIGGTELHQRCMGALPR